MKTFTFRTKPLATAIAMTLSIGCATAATARNANVASNGSGTARTMQNSVQTQDSNISSNAKKKMSRANSEKSKKKAEQLNTVVVNGIIGSQDRDIQLKRYSSQIEDSITSQSIGQLPDVDVSDALQRVTGVQINRSAGQGTTVSIRGIAQVKTTLNGEEYLNAGGGDQYNNPIIGTGGADFEAVPSSLVKGIDVLKSTTASDVAGGISGIINLKTYRPFDFKKKWTFNGSAEGMEGDRVRKFNKSFNALAAYHNDRWGVLLEASYSDQRLADKTPNVGNSGIKATEQDAGFDFNGDGVIGNGTDASQRPRDYYYAWANVHFGNQTARRKRTGIHGSAEYKFNDEFTLISDIDYSKYHSLIEHQDVSLLTNNATFVKPGANITPDGVLLNGTTGYAQMTEYSKVDNSTSKAINTNLELRYDGGGIFSGDMRWVHAHTFRDLHEADVSNTPSKDATITLPDGTMRPYNPKGFRLVDATIDYTGQYPAYNFVTDISNPANWLEASSWGQANKIDVQSDIFRGDGTLHFDSGIFDSLQFGARYQKKDYTYNTYKYLSPVSPEGSCPSSTQGPKSPLYFFRDGQITDACTGFSEVKAIPFNQLPAGYVGYLHDFNPLHVTGVGAHGIPAIQTSVMKNAKAFLDSLSPGEELYQSPQTSYLVNEKIISAYAQLNFNGRISFTDTPWTANIGLRGVRTKIDIGSYVTNGADFIGNTASFNGVLINKGMQTTTQQYTTWLPAANVAFNITPDQKLRLAFAKTEARQDLGILAQGLNEYFGANGNPPRYPDQPEDLQIFGSASRGNPKLLPYRSKNYNASYAWYFNPHSIAYLGAFLMQVASFPKQVTIHADLPDADGVVRAGGPLTTYVNGGRSLIRGLEGEFRTQFTFLPGPLSGLGTQLNYTYANTGKTGLSSNTYNAIAFYQKYGFQVRVAYNWRSRNFVSTNSTLGDPLNIYSKPVGYLDASINYDINKHISVFLQGTNLTDSYDNQYAQYPNAFYYQNISERRYYAGVRVSF